MVKKAKKEIKINLLENKKFYIVLGVLVLVFGIVYVFNKSKVDQITKVKKLSDTKNYSVRCVDSDCNYLIAYNGDKRKKYTVTIYNSYGKIVARFTENYDSKKNIDKEVYQATDNYFIYKKMNNKTNKDAGYAIANKKGNELYTTKNELSALTNDLILMKETKKEDNVYTILDKNGKDVYTNISDYEIYANGEVLSLVQNDKNVIILQKNNQIIDDYSVREEIKDSKDNTLYLILQDSNKNSFYYFNVTKGKIVGDSFQNYSKTENEGELTISRNENGKTVKYALSKNGNQIKKEDSFSQNDVVSNIRKKIDTKKYYIYSNSIAFEKQNYIFVDDVKNRKFGVYSLETKKFYELYSYKEEGVFSSNLNNLSTIDSDAYFQVTCSTYYCDTPKLIVYDLKNNEKLYEQKDSNLKAQRYTQYAKGYKVIKYSSQTNDEKYSGKYVLYDKKDKELYTSSNVITLVDEKLLLGSVSNSSLILYSNKKGKVLNDDNSLAKIVNVSGKKYFNYKSEDKVKLISEKGKELVSLPSSINFIYSNDSIIYVDGSKIGILNVTNDKVSTYKLKEKEKINDETGSIIPPYRNSMFINNTQDNYFKVINIKGKIIKTVKKQKINSVKQSAKSKNIFIVTKKIKNNNNYYGIYLAK